MNNRGSVLVLFVLLLPIFMLLLVLSIDIANLVSNRLSLDNINHILVDYSLDNIDSISLLEDVSSLAIKNDKNIDINIVKYDDKINIVLNKNIKGIINKSDIYKLESNFIGYLDNDKKIIKRKVGDDNE